MIFFSEYSKMLPILEQSLFATNVNHAQGGYVLDPWHIMTSWKRILPDDLSWMKSEKIWVRDYFSCIHLGGASFGFC